MMKLAIRLFALVVVAAGGTASTVPTHSVEASVMPHLSVASALPIPLCGPGMNCPVDPNDGK